MPVIVTRPEPDASRWVQALAGCGLPARALPLIEIGPAPDAAALQAARERRDTFDALMFVSGNAVAAFFEPKMPTARMGVGPIAIKSRAWVTGPGSREALLAAGVPPAQVDAPAADAGQFDSEALWARVQPQLRPGLRVLLVRGGDAGGQAAGRPWLADRLVEAGAVVETVVAYVRRPPFWSAADIAAARAAAAGEALWHFSSSEAVGQLAGLLPGQDWSAADAVATHPRIARAARDAGFGRVGECRPGLDGLLDFLQSRG